MRGRWRLPRRSPVAALGTVVLGAALLLIAFEVQARVGGGQSFSGGGSGSGGGGGGGDTIDVLFLCIDLLQFLPFLVELTFKHPMVGIPLDLFLIYVIYVVYRQFPPARREFAPDPVWREQRDRQKYSTVARGRLRALAKKLDPDFSLPLFLDFAHALYSTAQHARGDRKLDAYSGYLSAEARESLRRLNPSPQQPQSRVQGVVIGSCTLTDVSPLQTSTTIRITVEYEANYTEVPPSGPAESWYSRETWVFSRAPGVRSRPPARIRQIACPACGGAPNADSHGLCPYCGNTVRSGTHDWYVERVSIKRTPKPPLLESTVLEKGTDMPTLFDPQIAVAEAGLGLEFPDWNREKFRQRAVTIFHKLQDAWTRRQWELIRPFETDALFETHQYWIQEYKRQRRVNVLQQIRVTRVEIVKAESDKYFASITARIHGSMIDFTQDDSSRILSGNPRQPRVFTEYWTFVRGRSPLARKSGVDDVHCPGCGSELKIGMTGECEYCGSKVTAGNFDWVLSSIEQDEAYSG